MLIILCVPTLQNIFYEQSKVWLRQVEPYKTSQMTGLMQLLSVMGDGEFFFYMIIAVCYGRGKTYDYCYLSTCFILNYHWGNMLKQALHHSRPQFDDPTLAHENYGDCASEFGNPSGHMLATTQFFITLILFYKDKNPTLFKENQWVSMLLKGTCFIIVLLMGFSRWYLGRHSIDQIIIGAMLGALSAHFFFYCMKPHMFDPVFHPDFPQLPAAKLWDYFLTSAILCGLLIGQVVSIYIYVEKFVQIPAAWTENMLKICSDVKLTEKFHYNNCAIEGYMVIFPAHYFWKAFQNSEVGKKLYIDTSNLQSSRVPVTETLFKIALVIAADFLVSDFIPLTFFGTKDLDLMSDFIFKRVLTSLFLSAVALSPIDNLVQKLFRTPYSK